MMGETKMSARSAPLQWKKVLLLIVIGGALLLTGCPTIDMEVTFYGGERWEYSAEFIFTKAAVEMMGGAEAAEDSLRSELAAFPELDVSIRQERRDQDVVFHVTTKGEGWETLSDFAFDGRADITRQNGEIHIQASIPPEIGMMLSSLTLHGGRVIESNADQVISGRAIWNNPSGTIWVTLTDKRPADGLIVPLIVIFGLLVVGGVVVFAYLGKRKSLAKITVPVEIACPQCGTASSSGDKFCQNCGSGL